MLINYKAVRNTDGLKIKKCCKTSTGMAQLLLIYCFTFIIHANLRS